MSASGLAAIRQPSGAALDAALLDADLEWRTA
jgi:hypothetical protein